MAGSTFIVFAHFFFDRLLNHANKSARLHGTQSCGVVVFGGLSLGAGHTLIAKHDGTVWATGVNNYGQLGIDPEKNAMISNAAMILSGGAKGVAAGSRHTMVVKQDGSVWCTGRNIYGQLGDGSNIDRHAFVQVIPIYAKAVSAGTTHSLVLMQDDSV